MAKTAFKCLNIYLDPAIMGILLVEFERKKNFSIILGPMYLLKYVFLKIFDQKATPPCLFELIMGIYMFLIFAFLVTFTCKKSEKCLCWSIFWAIKTANIFLLLLEPLHK